MYIDIALVPCRRLVCHVLNRPDVRYTKGFYRAVTTPASNSASASRRLHTFAAKQSAAGTLLIAAAVKHVQADLLTTDLTSVGAENVCSEQITLGQPLICMSTTLTAEVCMQSFCCSAIMTLHLLRQLAQAAKLSLKVVCKLSHVHVTTAVALATYRISMLCRQTMRLVWKV